MLDGCPIRGGTKTLSRGHFERPTPARSNRVATAIPADAVQMRKAAVVSPPTPDALKVSSSSYSKGKGNVIQNHPLTTLFDARCKPPGFPAERHGNHSAAEGGSFLTSVQGGCAG